MIKALGIIGLIPIALAAMFFVAKGIRSLTVCHEPAQLNTDHFVVNYQGIYKESAEEVGRALESNYQRIRSVLRDPEHGVITIYIHPNQEEFNKATGLMHSTAIGTSRGPLEFHMIWTNWLNSFLPHDPEKTAVHEFTHCVQLNILIHDAIGSLEYKDEKSFNEAFEKKFAVDYPQWFWEAVCAYEAEEVNRLSVVYGMRSSNTLRELSQSNQIYNVGYTIIEYFVHQWGKDKLSEFIRSYCNFEKVLGVSEEEFEQGWKKYVAENY
jgi:hypothetical protein